MDSTVIDWKAVFEGVQEHGKLCDFTDFKLEESGMSCKITFRNDDDEAREMTLKYLGDDLVEVSGIRVDLRGDDVGQRTIEMKIAWISYSMEQNEPSKPRIGTLEKGKVREGLIEL